MFEILPIGHGRKLFLKENGALRRSEYKNFITLKVGILNFSVTKL